MDKFSVIPVETPNTFEIAPLRYIVYNNKITIKMNKIGVKKQ